ncbi:UNC93-like protein [Trichonephila clavata]|uniref:UNC93-like protein n=1 Tax=Trichonephila clavata TaxID=2740835 RepID=A0A8X6LCV6_TRICU|nr:UNC93-like protein [Trichonephila clavata]
MLQTTMNKKEGIGTASQAVIYISYGLSSITLSRYIIKKFGTKITLFVAVILYLPYIAANFYPSWITMIPSAVLVGIGTTLIWGAQCTYFNESCVLYCTIDEDARLENLEHGKKADLYSSVSEDFVDCRNNDQRINELSVSELQYKIDNTEVALKDSHSRNNRFVANELAERTIASELRNNSLKQAQEVLNFNSERIIKTQTSEVSSVIKDTESREINLKHSETASVSTERENSIPFDPISADHVTDKKISNSNSSFASTNALFFGWHGLAYYSAQVSSNLMSFYVLQRDSNEISQRNYNLSCGSNYCNFKVESFSNETEDVTRSTRYFLTAICISFSIVAAMLIFLLLDPMEKSKETVKFSWTHIIATIKYSKKKEQILLIPLTIFVSMCQGIYTADFTKAYIACSWSTSQIGLVTVFYGMTSALSSMLSGFIIKYTGRIPVFLLGQIFNTINFVFLLLWNPQPHNPSMYYLAGGLWGTFIGIYLSQLRAFYGILFQGDEEAAFGSRNSYKKELKFLKLAHYQSFLSYFNYSIYKKNETLLSSRCMHVSVMNLNHKWISKNRNSLG